jgi:hypothetical protein
MFMGSICSVTWLKNGYMEPPTNHITPIEKRVSRCSRCT